MSKKAPIQWSVYAPKDPYKRFLQWDAHYKARQEYARRGHGRQSAERIAERGGFGDGELDDLYPEWHNFLTT